MMALQYTETIHPGSCMARDNKNLCENSYWKNRWKTFGPILKLKKEFHLINSDSYLLASNLNFKMVVQWLIKYPE